MGALTVKVAPVLDGLKRLGTVRLAALGGVAAVVLGGLTMLAFQGGGAMAPLYGELDPKEAGQVADQLDRAHVPYRVEAGGRLMVPADQVARVRMLLAKDGLPGGGGSPGYELFDRGDTITASAFQQGILQTRALEGEVARSLRTLQGVKAARVHLVLPRRDPFQRERADAQASIMLTMTGAGRLDREAVQAVLNLVSAAVPGLRPQNVAVVDQRGNVLARAGEPVGPAASAQTTEELRRTTEQRLSHAVEEMLERAVGAGRVRAEASVELDVDQVRETQERFDPDGQVVRSQQSNNSTQRSTEAAGTVSVQNNLPNADAGQQGAGAGSQEARQEETTNYEIGKTTRTVVRDQPQMRRLSLAVLVDGVVAAGPDGVATWRPRSEDELRQLTALARNAVGFDEKRGDKVDVVSLRFVTPAVDEVGPPTMVDRLAAWGFAPSALLRLAEAGLLTLVVLAALLLVARPVMLRLAQPAELPPAEAPAAVPQLTDNAIEIARVDGALHEGSVRRIVDLVDKNPEASVAIVRGWMNGEAA